MGQITHIGLSFMGYSRPQVERLIEQKDNEIQKLESKVATLENEVRDIQSKLTHYIEIEDVLKDSIVDAKLTGNKILEESNETAGKLIDQTNLQISHYKEEFSQQSHELMNSGTDLKEKLNQMKHEMLEIVSKYEAMLNDTNFDALYPEDTLQRFGFQLGHFEEEELLSLMTKEELKLAKELSLTDNEKKELQNLIQAVLTEEEETDDKANASTKKKKRAKKETASQENSENDNSNENETVLDDAPAHAQNIEQEDAIESAQKVSGSDQAAVQNTPTTAAKLVRFTPKHTKRKK